MPSQASGHLHLCAPRGPSAEISVTSSNEKKHQIVSRVGGYACKIMTKLGGQVADEREGESERERESEGVRETEREKERERERE